MDGKRDADGAGRRNATTAKRKMERSQRLAERLNDILAKGAEGSLDELERAAKIVGSAAKSGQSLHDLEAQNKTAGSEDERLDIIGEQRLRAELIRRLDAVAVRLEQAGVRRCPGCGRFEIDRHGLEQLGGAGAKPAAG